MTRSNQTNLTTTTRRRLLRQAGAAGAMAGLAGMPLTRQAAAKPTTLNYRAAQDAPTGEITYTSVRDVFTFDPIMVNTTEEMGLMQHVCEPLVRLDANLDPIPHLAETWEAVDPLIWELKLREGVQFHNGEPFNAEAVRFSFEAIRRAGEEYRWYYLWPGELPEVEIVDDLTVRLVSTTAIATTPRNLVMLPIMPPEAGSQDNFGESPVGTGPYTFVEHQQDVRLVLQAFPDYWGVPPRIQQLTYRPIPDPSARMVAVQTGEVDVAASIPPDLVPALEAVPQLNIHQNPGVRIAHYPFNFRNADSPVADVKVRSALTYAINGESILENVLVGAGQALQGPVPSTLYAAADLGGFPPYNPEQAQQLLQEAGYPEGYELTLIYTPGEFIKDREVTEAIQAQLSEAGLSVNFEELEGGAYTERRRTADWDIAINGFSTQNGDPGYFLTWATSDPTTFGYDNQATKDAIAGTSGITDEAERSEQLIEAQELYWEDVPYLWGFTQTDTVAISDRVTGVQPLSNGWILFGEAEIVE